VVAELTWHGVPEFEAGLSTFMAKIGAETMKGVAEGAHLIEAQAKQNASGRPGPNVVTGTLRRSIHVLGPTPLGIGGAVAFVGPTVIYGRRVELGYSGTDSLGRNYKQQPFPFLGPAYKYAVSVGLPVIFRRRWGSARP
jgi:hypothetical protein